MLGKMSILLSISLTLGITAVAWILFRIAINNFEKKAEKTDTLWDDHAVFLAKWLGRALLGAFAISGILHSFGLTLHALIGIGGFGGLSIALAAKTAVSQGIGFLLLRTGRHIRVGETISIKGTDVAGEVEAITLSRVEIRRHGGDLALVPCDTVAKSIIVVV